MVVQEFMTRFSGDSSGFKKSADEVKDELTQLTIEYNNNRRAISTLQREINSQSKALQALRKEMEETGGGTEEQKQQCEELEKVINEATVRISQMQVSQTELRQNINSVTVALRAQRTELNDVDDELNDTNDNADDTSIAMDNVKESFGKFCDVCKAGIIILSTVSKALINTTINAANMADELNSLSEQTGISVEELQKYKYTQESVSVSLEDYTSGIDAVTRAIKEYQSGNTDVILALDDLGVSIYDSNGAIKDSQILFNDIVNTLGNVSNSATQDAYAFTLLGDSASVYLGLMNGGTETLKEFGNALQEVGLILNEEQISDLQTVQDNLNGLKSKAEALTNLIGASAAPAMSEILEIIDEIIMNVNDAIQDGELQPYIDLITGMLKTLANLLKGGISTLIEWKELIIGIGVAFATWKVITTIQGMVKAINEAELAQKAFNAISNQNPYILVGSAIIGVISGIVAKIKSATSETDSFTQAVERLNNTVNDIQVSNDAEITKVTTLAEKYEQLRKNQNATEEQQTQLYAIAKELEESYPNQISLIDKKTGAYKALGEQAENVIATLKKETEMKVLEEEYETYFKLVKDLEKERHSLLEYFDKTERNVSTENQYEEKVNKLNEKESELADARKKLAELEEDYFNLLGTENNEDNKEDKKLSSMINNYSDLEEKLDAVIAAEEEFADSGRLTSNTLSDIISKYPELINSVKEYINGTKDEIELLDELENCYNKDLKNLNGTIKSKIEANNDFYQALLINNADMVNGFLEYYEIDLNNYQTYNEAKYAIANETLGKICEDWDKYYNIDTQSYTMDLNKLFATDPKTANEILNAVPKYNAIMDDLHTKMRRASVVDSTVSSSSSSSNNTLDKFTLANEAYKKLVDDRIKMIEELRDTQVNAIQDQIDAIDKEIEARNRLKEDTSIQDEIDAINAKLKYAQMDDFTRYELEKQLKELYQQQEDIAFERNAEDRKNSLQSQMEDIKNSASESVNALNEAMNTASEFFNENKNGYKSASQIVNNNSKSANINIINNALTSEQIATAIVRKLYD